MDSEFHIFHYQATPERDSLCFMRALRVRLKCHSMDSIKEEERETECPLEEENSVTVPDKMISYTHKHLSY